MTPFELDILLHYYAKCDDHDVVFNNPPIWDETREFFLSHDLLKLTGPEREATYESTERLKAYIEYICALPLPIHTWKMP